jgi:hypothetical protein
VWLWSSGLRTTRLCISVLLDLRASGWIKRPIWVDVIGIFGWIQWPIRIDGRLVLLGPI